MSDEFDPPTIGGAEEESTVDVSPAFQNLEQLSRDGEISPFKAAALRAKYSEAFQRLEDAKSRETTLVNSAKQLSETLEEQRNTLAGADQQTDDGDSEAARTRSKFLNQMNHLRATEERCAHQDHVLAELIKEKGTLERQLARIKPNEEEADQKKRDLEREQEDLRKENARRRQEIVQLREAIEQKSGDVEREQRQLLEAIKKQEELRSELIGPKLHTQPQQMQKEIEKLKRLGEQNKQTRDKLENRIKDIMSDIEAANQKHIAKQKDFEQSRNAADEERIKLERNKQQENKITYDLQAERDRAHMMRVDSAQLDQQLRYLAADRKHEHEILAKRQRELDRELRKQKRTEQQLKVALDSMRQMEQLLEKAKGAFADLPDSDELKQQRRCYMKEVEDARRRLASQQSRTAMEKVRHEEMLLDEEQLYRTQERERAALVELTRIAQIKADEREQKSRDLLRAQQRAAKIVTELRQRDLVVQDHRKRCLEVQSRQEDFAKLYDVIKNEKNKYVHLIQASTQKAAELRDKLRILANEVEILQGSATQKARSLKKAELNLVQHCAERDAARKEKSKVVALQNQIDTVLSSRMLEVDRLNMLSTRAEEDAKDLLVRYEKAVQHRNERGVTLVEREEEVCIFYERLNVQEKMIRNGEMEIHSFDEEMRFLKLQLTEEMRQIELLRVKEKPRRRKYEDDVVELQIQLCAARQEVKVLEEKLANPERARELGGVDPDVGDLKEKLEDIQKRLASVEDIALEKELLFQHVCRLVEKEEENSTDAKTPALELSRQINAAQSQLVARTRSTMARVAELSMVKAKLVERERQRVHLTELLEESLIRLDRGLPPNDETELEWARMRKRLKSAGGEGIPSGTAGRDMTTATTMGGADHGDHDAEDYYLVNGIYTTAPPRPNAYIPKDGSLPLPRPYGALAPFKPTQPGSTMRHIRKPNPKPIDI